MGKINLILWITSVLLALEIQKADQGYTLSVESGVFRARINVKFPSFLGVLHDAGCPADPLLGYYYGWWTNADFQIDGEWLGLQMPIWELKDWKIIKGKNSLSLLLEVRLKKDPSIRIRSRYTFLEGVTGFEMEREFISRKGKRIGPIGLWLGGILSEFPLSNASSPDSYFYEGEWHSSLAHSWEDIHSLRGGPKGEEPLVIFYWSSLRRYLICAIVPEGLGGGIKALQFRWREAWKDPCWAQNTGLFDYGRYKVRFLIGRGGREEALKRGRELLKGKWQAYHPPNRAKEPQGKIAYISNSYYRIGIDERRGEIVSLRVDPKGEGKWSKDLLEGTNCRIYFGGGSPLQRSIYPLDTYPAFLMSKNLKLQITSPTSASISNSLSSPLNSSPLLWASLSILLSGDTLILSADFQSTRDLSLPYIGWHLDFPTPSWQRFFNSIGGYFHKRMLEGYKMRTYDLQPCYRPIGGDLIAYGDATSLPAFKDLLLEVRDGGSSTPFFVHLPNPLFDEPLGISKIAITPCPLAWEKHNCAPMRIEKGKKYHLTALLRILTPYPPPDLGTFRIHLPHAREVEEALNNFHLEHCWGGPLAPDGLVPFFWLLAGQYNPRFDLRKTRENLSSYLSAIADGQTTRDEEGNILPRGMLPIARLGEGRWMWRWNQRGYIFEVNAQFILASWRYVILSRDLEFLKEAFPKLEEAFSFYRSMVDEEEILTLPEPFNGLPTQHRPATYWDGWNIGHRYSLLQVYYTASAMALSQLASLKGDTEKAQEYQGIAERAREALVKVYWREGDIRDNEGRRLPGGRFLSWIDKNGKEIDVGFTDIPLLANYFGLLSPDNKQKVLLWLDSDPNAYSWRDGRTGKPCGIPSINTIDGNKEAFYAGIWNPFQTAPGMENGQTQFWQGGFDWFTRAERSPSDAWKKIKEFTDRARRGDLARGHGLPSLRPLPMFGGTSTFSADDQPVGSDQGLLEDGILLSVGIVEGIAGLRLDEEKIWFQPSLPWEMRDLYIENIRCGEKILNLRFKGWGRKSKKVEMNGMPTHLPLPRSSLEDGSILEIELEPA